MFKRLIDIVLSVVIVAAISPVILISLLVVYIYDFKNPLYISSRVGENSRLFKMIKIRTMCANADKSGVDSTSSDDKRITLPGKYIRKFKIDELMQLFNVIKGDMSLVGPRPNVLSETSLYTAVENNILSVKPGITDFSSIVFSDLGEILEGSTDANLRYNQYVRPWKSRLCLFYVENFNVLIDIALIFLTILSVFSRRTALLGVARLLEVYSAPEQLIKIARRDQPLKAYPPPGSDEIVLER